MSKAANKQVADRLRTHVADATVLWYAIHNDHWFVKGPQFFTLHEHFEDLYTRWGQIVDDLAERLLSIGASPVGTLVEVLDLATIDERQGTPSAQDRVALLIDAITAIHAGMGETIALAEKDNDRGTVNLLDEILDVSEKNLWMLRAFNAK